jgi:peptidoglycan/LPS O-acetylase OafA/YrhL
MAALFKVAFTNNTLHATYDFKSIQVLRFVAALMVLFCHASFYVKERLNASFPIYELGANGVPLFFVISGFVMVLSSEKLITLNHSWKIFALKRFSKIVPLYWIVTTFKVFLFLLMPGLILHSNLNALYIIKSYLFIPALNKDGLIEPLLGVGWTLNLEMFFYLLFTLALLFKWNRILFPGAIVLFLYSTSFLKDTDWHILGFYRNQIIINFLLGMIAAYFIQKKRYLPKSISIIAIAIGLLYLFLPRNDSSPILSSFYLVNLSAFLVIYSCASLEKLNKIYFNSYFLFFGAASYSIYLIHPIVAPLAPVVLNRIGVHSSSLSIFLSIIITLTTASFIYSFVENPISQYLNNKIRKLKL